MEKGKTDELFEPFNWTNNTEQTEKKAVELTREQTKARTNERKLVRMNESSYEQRKLVRTNEYNNEWTNEQTSSERNKLWNEKTNEQAINERTSEMTDERIWTTNGRLNERMNDWK